ncbi:MAG: hypothetical protein AABX51_04795 [Nanoarchaeota archaeon]
MAEMIAAHNDKVKNELRGLPIKNEQSRIDIMLNKNINFVLNGKVTPNFITIN